MPICSPYTVYKKRIEDEIAQEKAEKTGRMFIARPLSPSLASCSPAPLAQIHGRTRFSSRRRRSTELLSQLWVQVDLVLRLGLNQQIEPSTGSMAGL